MKEINNFAAISTWQSIENNSVALTVVQITVSRLFASAGSWNSSEKELSV